MALQKTVISIPISDGLDTKTDSKQVMAGKALALENVRFHKTGKLSKRFGLAPISAITSDGGSINAYNVRNVASDNSQLAVLTDNGVYNLSYKGNFWKKTSEFNSPSVIETEYVSKSGWDSYLSDCDYLESARVVATVSIHAPPLTTPYLSISLKNLGNDQVTSIRYPNPDRSVTPRVIVTEVGGELRVLVFYRLTDYGIVVLDQYLDEVIPFTSIFSPTTAQMDVVKDDLNVYLMRKQGSLLYTYKFSLGGVLQGSGSATTSVLRIMSGSLPAGFSCDLNGDNIHCIWPVDTGNTVIVAVNKVSFTVSIPEEIINIASQTVGIVSDSENIYITRSNFPTSAPIEIRDSVIESYSYTSGSYVGLTSVGRDRLTILAKPFIINQKAYFPLFCDEPEQRTGFVVDLNFNICLFLSPFQIAQSPARQAIFNENYMVSKSSASDNFKESFFAFERYFSNPDSVDSFETIPSRGTSLSRFRIPELYETGGRSKVGDTLYLTNGLTLELDARKPHENGFMLAPKINATTATTGGNLAAGTYSYVGIYEFYDSKGQVTRSQVSAISTVTTTGATSINSVAFLTLPISYKGNLINARENERVNFVLYRTETLGSVFYRINSQEISLNSPLLSISDTASDVSIRNNATLYTTGLVLENNPCPISSFQAAGGNRLLVGGLEERDELAFSKKQLFGEAVNFTEFFRIRVSSASSGDKTRLSAAAYMDGKWIIFRQQSIYYCQGDGPTETGEGAFTDPEIISSDTGCEDPRSVINTPIGVMFKSRKGIYLLDRALSVSYIGAPVEAYNNERIVSSIISDKFNEIRFYTTNFNCLCYNYVFGTWSVLKNQTSVDADTWKGDPVILQNNYVHKETENLFKDGSTAYSMKFTSPWLKLNLVQGYQRCYQLWIIGDYKSPHTLKCRVYTDYDDSIYDDYDLVYNQTSSPQYQFQISLPRQKVESIKFEIYDTNQSGSGESFELSNIQAEVGMKSGGYKLAANKSY